ncbi:hypothetical protein PINS_up001293 [Pythium insidiosum]|nr:hypothetical protein PINS_up001293 [Pythium insidiosum]
MEDDLYTLTPQQQRSVEMALRNGRAFRSVAEQHQKARLTSIGNVALAKLNLPRRRGSEWAPDLLPRLLNRMDDAERDKEALPFAREPKLLPTSPLNHHQHQHQQHQHQHTSNDC